MTGPTFNPAAATFPNIEGDNLNNRRIVLPAGIDAPYALLLVAFEREQQADVDTWLPAARELTNDHANLEYYELPVIPSGYGLVRGWIDGGMRGGIPAFAARERTVTVYTDVAKFKRLAGFDSPAIRAVLVDRQGLVYWSGAGAATPEALSALRDTARRLLAPEAP